MVEVPKIVMKEFTIMEPMEEYGEVTDMIPFIIEVEQEYEEPVIEMYDMEVEVPVETTEEIEMLKERRIPVAVDIDVDVEVPVEVEKEIVEQRTVLVDVNVEVPMAV